MYTPKKGLIDGYKLGLDRSKKYVAVPWGVYSKQEAIALGNTVMQLKGKEPIITRTFPDQYGRGFDYALYYYEADFNPVKFGDVING